jgi:hypothetical protein
MKYGHQYKGCLEINKKSAIGKKIVEEPKPATVPMISDINADIKNNISYSIV